MISESFRYAGDVIKRSVTAGRYKADSVMEMPSGFEADRPPEQAWWLNIARGAPVQVVSCAKLKSIRGIDLFSSVGGLSLGAAFASQAVGLSLDHTLAVDLDQNALRVYQRNFPTAAIHQGNVAAMIDYHVYGRAKTARLAYPPEITDPELRRLCESVDLVLAGPPCEGHSSLNNHTRRSDPRNQLYVTAAVIGIALQARMIVIENVPAVEHARTEVVVTARTLLESSGYFVSQGVLNGSLLGSTQARRRHFTIATLEPHIPVQDAATALVKSPMTLWDAIGDLESKEPDGYMDEVPVLSARNMERIDFLFREDVYELPDEIRPDSHRNGHTYPSVYGRLRWEQPAPTITTGFMTPGRGRFIHPSQRRVITAREAARIQGFPDGFVFDFDGTPPSRKSLTKWIGDAVPTQLGYTAVLTALTGLKD